jgi:hypothetical protein
MVLFSSVRAMPGDTWQYLAIPGNTWQYLAIPGNTWQYLAIPGNTWQYLAILFTIHNNIKQYLPIVNNT